MHLKWVSLRKGKSYGLPFNFYPVLINAVFVSVVTSEFAPESPITMLQLIDY